MPNNNNEKVKFFIIAVLTATELLESDLQETFVYRASVAKNWGANKKLISMSYVGNYFLTLKEGVNKKDNNYLCMVYKIQATTPTQGKNIEYYYFFCYPNIIKLEDGTCSADLSKYLTPTTQFSVGLYSYRGYKDLDTLYNRCIISSIDKYEYTTNFN